MNTKRILLAASLCTTMIVVTCCAPRPEAPPPVVQAPAPAPTPTPTPAPVIVQQAPENWIDAPATPGDWTYRDGSGLSYAAFGTAGGPAVFGIECVKQTRDIRLVRGANLPAPAPMRIRTETMDRMLTATPSPDGRNMAIATLPAQDALLEAMAFSRGRFAVETQGLTPLYIPAWPEVTRIIEDCR